ncbi:hypothetical protein, partial [Rhodopirellula bahusiensis]|uniref:hypothetical protein n=1 Tax=Rhodopirellula bahusiensis TaxID=2014065 RepID=UPI00329A0869
MASTGHDYVLNLPGESVRGTLPTTVEIKGDGGNSVRPGVCQAGVLADGWRVECGFIAKEAKISGLP